MSTDDSPPFRWTFLRMEGFQSYRESRQLDLENDLTLLAGRNDVGKSAILRALRLHVQAERGASESCRVAYGWDVSSQLLTELVSQAVGAPGTNMEPDAWEYLQRGGRRRFTVAFATNNWDATGQMMGAGHWRMIEIAVDDAVFATGSQGEWRASGAVSDPKLAEGLAQAANALGSRVSFVAPRRPAAGALQLAAEDTLAPDASNLTSVVDFLANNDRHTKFAELESFITAAFPEITNVQVARQRGSSPLVGELYIVYGGREDLRVPLRYCGTGVEQLLALGVGVLTAAEPRLFLVDEPQAFLHPHAERSLLNLFEKYGQHQYVVATHSGVFLNNRPISKARLVTLEGASSEITEVRAPAQVLDELGVTAADLWLPDVVLWVEGPTEVEVINTVRSALGILTDVNCVVRGMPGASKFASGRQSEASFRFVDAVAGATAPRDPGITRFLFDRDEKSEELRGRIADASGGRARFLDVRELENLLLDTRILGPALREVAESVEVSPPADERVEEMLQGLLGSEADAQLFPGGESGGDPSQRIKGSEALKRLYWELCTAPYDKVRDGARLAELALAHAPEVLQPLVDVLNEVAEEIDAAKDEGGRAGA